MSRKPWASQVKGRLAGTRRIGGNSKCFPTPETSASSKPGLLSPMVPPCTCGANREPFLSPRSQRSIVAGAGEAQHVVGHFLHASFTERFAQWRHQAVAAVHDRGLDGFRIAAVEPILVAQVGKAEAAAGIGA